MRLIIAGICIGQAVALLAILSVALRATGLSKHGQAESGNSSFSTPPQGVVTVRYDG
jgi:hypothetical protein